MGRLAQARQLSKMWLLPQRKRPIKRKKREKNMHFRKSYNAFLRAHE